MCAVTPLTRIASQSYLSPQAGRGKWRCSPLRAQFPPVEFFLELMKGVVADLLGFAQPQDRSSRGSDRAPPQRVRRQFAGRNAASGIALRAQQQGAVFKPEDFRFLGSVAVDFLQRRAIGDGAGTADFGGHQSVVL